MKNKYQIVNIILIFLCFAFLFSCKNKAIVKDFIEKIMEAPENIEAICETSEINTDKFRENYLKTGYHYNYTQPFIEEHFQEGYEVIRNETVDVHFFEEQKWKKIHFIKIISKSDGFTLEFQFEYDETIDKLYFFAITRGDSNREKTSIIYRE